MSIGQNGPQVVVMQVSQRIYPKVHSERMRSPGFWSTYFPVFCRDERRGCIVGLLPRQSSPQVCPAPLKCSATGDPSVLLYLMSGKIVIWEWYSLYFWSIATTVQSAGVCPAPLKCSATGDSSVFLCQMTEDCDMGMVLTVLGSLLNAGERALLEWKPLIP